MNFKNLIFSTLLFSVLITIVHAVSLASPTPANNSFLKTNFLYVNLSFSVADNFSNVTNITYSLYGSSNFLSSTNSTSGSFNFTGLSDGFYYYNATFYNSTGQSTTATQVVTIDTVSPSISVVSSTPANNTYSPKNFLPINVSVLDANYANTTFTLSYPNGTVINSTTVTNSNFTNFTSLSNGNYTVTITATDLAGNTGNSGAYVFIVDNVNPLVSYSTDTVGANSSLVVSYFLVNLTVTEINFNYATFGLYWINGSLYSLANVTNPNALYVNYSVGNGNYTFNTTVYDLAGNFNTTPSTNVSVNLTYFYVSTYSTPYIDNSIIQVTWTTLGPTTGTVTYGTSSSALTAGSQSDSTLQSTHSINMTSLTCGTIYYYSIRDCDNFGNCFTNATIFSTSTTSCPTVTPNTIVQIISPGSSSSTPTPTPTPTATPTPTPTATPTPKLNTTDKSTAITTSVIGNSTILHYQYVLQQDVNPGDNITVEFTGLTCDDYNKGLIGFSIQPNNVTCGSVIAVFTPQTKLNRGDTFKVDVTVKKVLPASSLTQLASTKTTIVQEQAPVLTPTPEAQTTSNSGTVFIWILIGVAILTVIVFLQFKRK